MTRANFGKYQQYGKKKVDSKYFWGKWNTKVTPDKIIWQKWHKNGQNLQLEEIVFVDDKFPLKGKYVMTIVEAVSLNKALW